MSEETLNAVEEMGTALTELFEREAKALEDKHNPNTVGRREAYEACALAVIKATTRKMVMIAPMDFQIRFRVPAEAKP